MQTPAHIGRGTHPDHQEAIDHEYGGRVKVMEGRSVSLNKILNWVEDAGNRLPDPAMLFLMLMLAVWLLSWPLSSMGLQRPASAKR